MTFAHPFLLFPKAPTSLEKNWKLEIGSFWSVVLLFVWVQKASQIFKILFQTRDIDTFVLLGVFFGSISANKTLLF